jgi:hypothetical protein
MNPNSVVSVHNTSHSCPDHSAPSQTMADPTQTHVNRALESTEA